MKQLTVTATAASYKDMAAILRGIAALLDAGYHEGKATTVEGQSNFKVIQL